jgi:hypothetical protein
MSQASDFYDARADDAEAAAGRAELENVRDREMRSAAVFRLLADNARKVDIGRAKAESIRRERQAVEADEAARAHVSKEGQ